MSRLRIWMDRLLRRPPPQEPGAKVRYYFRHMSPAARARAEAIRAEAIEDFGSEASADDWLCASIPFLGNRRPIEIMHTERGASGAAETLFNMRHGIYS
jgi:putative toxin-antitoxin system antitoxin component (TIGR02293 family)